jgi:hypothetical protein
MGDKPIDIIVVPGIASHIEFLHEFPEHTRFLHRLATFARVVIIGPNIGGDFARAARRRRPRHHG